MNQGLEHSSQSWSYYAWLVKVPSINKLIEGLNALGSEGWELVSSATTVKTWINLTGNDLIFVFKKKGLGHSPTNQTITLVEGVDPTIAY